MSKATVGILAGAYLGLPLPSRRINAGKRSSPLANRSQAAASRMLIAELEVVLPVEWLYNRG